MFSPDRCRVCVCVCVLRDTAHAVQVSYTLLSKRHYKHLTVNTVKRLHQTLTRAFSAQTYEPQHSLSTFVRAMNGVRLST